MTRITEDNNSAKANKRVQKQAVKSQQSAAQTDDISYDEACHQYKYYKSITLKANLNDPDFMQNVSKRDEYLAVKKKYDMRFRSAKFRNKQKTEIAHLKSQVEQKHVSTKRSPSESDEDEMDLKYNSMFERIQKLERESQEKENEINRLKQELVQAQQNANESDKGLSLFDASSEKIEETRNSSTVMCQTPNNKPKFDMMDKHEYQSQRNKPFRLFQLGFDQARPQQNLKLNYQNAKFIQSEKVKNLIQQLVCKRQKVMHVPVTDKLFDNQFTPAGPSSARNLKEKSFEQMLPEITSASQSCSEQHWDKEPQEQTHTHLQVPQINDSLETIHFRKQELLKDMTMKKSQLDRLDEQIKLTNEFLIAKKEFIDIEQQSLDSHRQMVLTKSQYFLSLINQRTSEQKKLGIQR